MLAKNFFVISVLGNIYMLILSIALYREYKYLRRKLKNAHTEYLLREMSFVLAQLQKVAEKVGNKIEDLSTRHEYNRELEKIFVFIVTNADEPKEIVASACFLLKLICKVKLVCEECEGDVIINFFKFGINRLNLPLVNPMEFIINNLAERDEFEKRKQKCLQVINRLN